MRAFVTAIFALFLVSCNDQQDEPVEQTSFYYPTSNPDSMVAPPATPSPVAPDHLYASRDGHLYSYVAALSEDERNAGRAAGSVFTYAYLGKVNGRHTLANVRPDGSIINQSSCNDPCEIITFSTGEQIAYNPASVIGSAYTDAIRGRLAVAGIQQPSPMPGGIGQLQPPLAPMPTPTPTRSTPPQPSWTADESALIQKWMAQNDRCRGAANATDAQKACDLRNEYSSQLAAFNICYYWIERPSAEARMHRCEANSLRF